MSRIGLDYPGMELDAVAHQLRSHEIEVSVTDADLPLRERARLSNEREDDYFISIKRCAFEQGARTYVHPKADPQAISLAQRIQNGLRDLGFTDRGVKMANLQLLRETNAPAVLVEIDNSRRESIVEVLVGAILDQRRSL